MRPCSSIACSSTTWRFPQKMGIHPRKVGLLGGFLRFRHNVWPFFLGTCNRWWLKFPRCHCLQESCIKLPVQYWSTACRTQQVPRSPMRTFQSVALRSAC
jgi:hypothetical protein